MTILDTIDNAVTDWETSPDAMRWTPEPPALTAQPLIFTPSLDQLAAAARLAVDFDRVRVRITAVAEQFAEAMKGIGAALQPILDEARCGKPQRVERVSRIRRAYRAKRRGW